jgi:hypothetical protein
MTQTQQLIKLMKKKWVTPMDALNHAQCFRLAARVHDIRESGIEVHDRWKKVDSGKKVKAYRIL